MAAHASAATKCFGCAAAAAGSNVGSDDQLLLNSSRRGFKSSEFSQQRRKTFFGSSVDSKIFTRGRRCSVPCQLGHNSGSRIFSQLHQDSEDHNSHEHYFPGESASSSSSSSITRSAKESSFEDQGMEAENQGASTSAIENQAKRGNFRMGRRMLLGAVSIGLSSLYYPSSSKGARAGNSEADMAAGEMGRGEGREGGEKKKDAGPGETESRVYDATVLAEPVAIGSEKDRVWKRLLESRVVYLGEAEKVADSDDKLLELEIVQNLRNRCFKQQRSVSLAFEAFPCPLQPQLDAYMSKKLTDEELRVAASHLPENLWLEYLPILQYCKNSGVRLVACGAPLEVLHTVQAKGVQALNRADTQKYIPPAEGGYKFKSSPLDNAGSVDSLPNASDPFGPGPYRFAQARIVADYTMAKVVTQIIKDGGALGLLLVITGASHVQCGTRGTGLPAWIAKNKEMQKRTQAVVLLNPERQVLRKEGDVPEADFLWYSAAKVCMRNCFDRTEVARVMGAAGIRRDALPQDLQVGLKQGLVAPEVLQSFFELEQNPVMAELTRRFQGVRERWLADPRFLQRLAIEETISITTTLIAQYERRAGRFWEELDYVATDTVRGAVVDFFTVWLPAPRLSFREIDPNETFNGLDGLTGLLGSFPDNAFQRPRAGESWGLGERVGGILVGGLKLFAVGFVSSVGTLAGTNVVLSARKYLSPETSETPHNKRSPIFKTALVYAAFLGTSANLRYQFIAGVVEHWVADYWLVSQPLAGNALSFVARVANSYFGTGQWVDLARFAGLQAHSDETDSPPSDSNGESDDVKTSELVSASSSRVKNHASTNGSPDQLPPSDSNVEGESDVVKTSELVSTSSSRIKDRASTNGSPDQLQEKLKVPKS